MFYSVTVGINGFFRYNRFQQEFRLKTNRYTELQQRQQKTKHMINDLQNIDAWETLSRTKLKMIKKDETALKFYYKDYNNGRN
ncbi:MAG: septum formation initiator family protein [Candidatus Margulisiibacteriota bacterium]